MPFETLEILLDVNSSALENKFTSVFKFIETNVTDINGKKIDWGSFMNTESLNSINWSALVSKVFSPANLVTFFAAMAAMGITSMMQIQQAASSAGGAAGMTASQISGLGGESQKILANIGSEAGGIKETTSAMSLFFSLLGNLPDASAATTQLGEALAATGGKFTDVMPQLIDFLHNIGASDLTDVQRVIGSLTKGVQLSGGNQSMSAILENLADFGVTAGRVDIPLNSVLKTITAFGSATKVMGVSQAKADFDALTTGLNGTNIILQGTSANQTALIKAMTDSGPKDAMSKLSKAISSELNVSQMMAIESQLGLNEKMILGLRNWDTYASKVIEDAPSQEKAILISKKAYDDTANSIRDVQTAYESLKGVLTGNVSVFTFFDKLLDVIKSIYDYVSSSLLGKIFGAIVNPIGAVTSGVSSAAGSIWDSIKKFVTGDKSTANAMSSNMSKVSSQMSSNASSALYSSQPTSVTNAPVFNVSLNMSGSSPNLAKDVVNLLKSTYQSFQFGTPISTSGSSIPLSSGGL